MNNNYDYYRLAADNGIGTVAFSGLNGFGITLVTITNDVINFDDTGIGRIRVNLPLYVGTNLFPNLNPHIQYAAENGLGHNSVLVLSGAAMTDLELLIGPLVFPYNVYGKCGGINPAIFQPGPTAAKSTQIYIQVTGLGLNQANGNYFKIKEIVLSGMDNIFYYIRIVSISDVIP
jgi:hypothetical protein